MNRSARIITTVMFALFAFVIYRFASLPWTPLRIVGLILMIAAIVLLTIARRQLGTSFSITPQVKHLVTRGIYSRIRNPIYVFSSLALMGLFLYMQKPYLLLILLVLIPLQIIRARAESRLLEEHFGDDYRRYKASTWF